MCFGSDPMTLLTKQEADKLVNRASSVASPATTKDVQAAVAGNKDAIILR
jgi:hypothetical protein